MKQGQIRADVKFITWRGKKFSSDAFAIDFQKIATINHDWKRQYLKLCFAGATIIGKILSTHTSAQFHTVTFGHYL